MKKVFIVKEKFTEEYKMKRLTALILTFVMLLTLVLPCSAVMEKAYVWGNFTVLWSEVGDDGLSLLLYGDPFDGDSSVCEVFLKSDEEYLVSVDDIELDINNSSISFPVAFAEAGFNALMNGERIAAGTEIALRYNYVEESYPMQIEGITEVNFPCRHTDLTVEQVENIFDELNELNGNEKFKFVNYEEYNFYTETAFTVLASRYDEEKDKYRLLISKSAPSYAVAYKEFRRYTDTSDIVLTDDITASDGSETGDMLLSLYKDKKPIPSGSVVILKWSGSVAESYPPIFEDIVGVTFTDKKTSYSLETAASEVKELNEMYVNGWDIPDEDDAERFLESREYAVVGYVPDPEMSVTSYGHPTAAGTVYMARKIGGRTEFLQAEIDAEKMAVLCESDSAHETYLGLLLNGELPMGTVVNAVYYGISDCDCYPPLIDGLSELTVTDRKSTDFSEAELKELKMYVLGEPEDEPVTEIYTVVKSEGHEMYAAKSIAGGVKVVRLDTDFHGSDIKIACTDENLRDMAEKFSKEGVLPVGTVIKITHTGIIGTPYLLTSACINYSLGDDDVKIVKITVTKRNSEFSNDNIKSIAQMIS